MMSLQAALCAILVAASLVATVRAATVVTGQILDFDKGYIVLTTGESYRVAPSMTITDATTGKAALVKPAPGLFARLTVGDDGAVTALVLSPSKIAANVNVTTPTVMSAPLTSTTAARAQELFAPVAFTVLVPSTTLSTDQVYLTTSETSWNPNAVRMDRVDARHFRVIILVPLRTTFLYLYTRGSPQSLERAGNGQQRKARGLTLSSTAAQQESDVVDHWGDEAGTTILPPPQTFPTPYNPAPFPNLPPSPRP